MAWTADDFLTSLKVRAMLADSGDTLTDAQLLVLGDDEIATLLAPLVHAAREDYWVTSADQTIVANTATYRIPSRALGRVVRLVTIVDGSGNEITIPRIALEDSPAWRSGGSWLWPHGQGHAIRGDQIVLVPTPTVAGNTLRVYYTLRRPRMVQTSAAGLITNINTGAKQVTISAVPSGFPTTSINYDFVKATPYFDQLAIDQAATRSGSVLTFTNALPADLAVNDYVALADESPLVPLPAELIPGCVSAALVRVLMAKADPRALKERALLEAQLDRVKGLFEPRNEGSAQRIVNTLSPLRAGRRYG